jgi:inhibitor of KinA sporulation pathway (predicted exonuclease)
MNRCFTLFMSNRISEIKIAFDLELEQPNTNRECPDSKISERKIIQVGWVIFNQNTGKILKENQAFINIGVPISQYIRKLTGISNDDIASGITLLEAVGKLSRDREEFGADRILYEWGSDTNSLLSELGGYYEGWSFGMFGFNVKHQYRVFAEARGLNPSGGLSKCVGRMGLKWIGQGKHNAVVDARNTALLSCEIFKRIKY